VVNMQTYIVDSFTDKAFKGNPAGVCVVESPISNELMLNIENIRLPVESVNDQILMRFPVYDTTTFNEISLST